MNSITKETRKESFEKLKLKKKCKLIYDQLGEGEYTARELAIKMYNTIDKEENRLLRTAERQETAPRLTELVELGLVEATGLSDREVRRQISELKKQRVVLYSSSRSGYRLAKEIRSMSEKEREEEVKLVEHSLNDCKSRTKQLRKQMRKYIAYLKKVEQIKLEEENYNHIPRID